ncbi:aldo/keto reductase, partial [bacterium]
EIRQSPQDAPRLIEVRGIAPHALAGEARRVLRRLPDLGVDFVDTAEAYGPHTNERLIADVLAPYNRGTIVATKTGLTRTGPDVWPVLGRPEFLRQGLETSLMRLKLETLPLWQLHRIDPEVPREDQFGVLKEAIDSGKVRHVGLSEVSVEEIEAARKIVPITTVQNLYNLANRQSEEVLTYCEREGIGFIPWFPVAAGDLAKPGGVLDEMASQHGATHAQLALAWLLKRSPVMLPIPGTSSLAHLEENVGAAEVVLSDDEYRRLEEAGRASNPEQN